MASMMIAASVLTLVVQSSTASGMSNASEQILRSWHGCLARHSVSAPANASVDKAVKASFGKCKGEKSLFMARIASDLQYGQKPTREQKRKLQIFSDAVDEIARNGTREIVTAQRAKAANAAN